MAETKSAHFAVGQTEQQTSLEVVARYMKQQQGVSREQFSDFVMGNFRKLAAADKWRSSELAATLADVSMVCDKVWGKNG